MVALDRCLVCLKYLPYACRITTFWTKADGIRFGHLMEAQFLYMLTSGTMDMAWPESSHGTVGN